MSTFTERVRSARALPGSTVELPPPGFAEEFPALCEALIGVISERAEDTIPAHTLMVFVREGRLRFSLSSKDSDTVFFGEADDPVKGLWSIEDAIQRGRLGQKTDRQAKRR